MILPSRTALLDRATLASASPSWATCRCPSSALFAANSGSPFRPTRVPSRTAFFPATPRSHCTGAASRRDSLQPITRPGTRMERRFHIDLDGFDLRSYGELGARPAPSGEVHMSDVADMKGVNRGAPSRGRREVLGALALGGAYVAPAVLAGMMPMRAAAASAGSASYSSTEITISDPGTIETQTITLVEPPAPQPVSTSTNPSTPNNTSGQSSENSSNSGSGSFAPVTVTNSSGSSQNSGSSGNSGGINLGGLLGY